MARINTDSLYEVLPTLTGQEQIDALNKIADELREDGVILQEPNMEGRQLVMFVGPKS